MTITLDGTNGITTPMYNGAVSSNQVTPVTTYKNRIINGSMVVSQYNGTSSFTPVNNKYAIDRWQFQATQASKFNGQQNLNSVTPPAGFTNYYGLQVSSAYSIGAGDNFNLTQNIEGYNTADLGWGTASAKTVTLSFQVYSSLTGTFGGSICNYANNRSYPFTYSIPVANTWTSISITIPGDTTGTWNTTNSGSLVLNFGLGVGSTYSGTAGSWAGAYYISATGATSVVGTNSATFYLTGVQLEQGASATSFDYRPYGTELALCQRYYESSGTSPALITIGTNSMGYGSTTSNWVFSSVSFLVSKRTAPTMTITGTGGGSNVVSVPWFGTDLAAATGAVWQTSNNAFNLWNQSGTNTSPGNYAIQFLWKASAEL